MGRNIQSKDVDVNQTQEKQPLADDLAVDVRGLTKSFGTVQALRG